MSYLFQLARKGADIASTGTITLPVDAGDRFDITGTTTVSAFGLDGWEIGSRVLLGFSGILTLTHGAGLALRGGEDYTTAANDLLEFEVTADGLAQLVRANNGGTSGGGGTAGVLQGIALDDVPVATRLGVRAHGGSGIQDLSDPTSNSSWNTAIAALAEYSRSFAVGVIASASSLWNGELLLNLKAAGAPPALEVVGGAVHHFEPATPGTTAFTVNGSGDIVAGDSLSAIQAALQATGGEFADVLVSGVSALATDGDNVLTGGTATASSTYGSPTFDAPKAFDGDITDRYISEISASSPQYLTYDRGAGVPDVAAGATFGLWVSVNYPTSFLVESSPDNSTWTTVVDGSAGAPAGDDWQYFATTGAVQRYFRYTSISWIDTSGNGRVFVNEIKLTSDPTGALLILDLAFPASVDTVALPAVTGTGGTAGYTQTTAGALVADGVTVTQL